MAAKRAAAKTEEEPEEGAVGLEMGTDVENQQVILRIGVITLRFSVQEAEEFAADMANRVFELRNGGKLS
jgi:hypothetical protein